jgi:hypothetical protein
VEHYGKMGAAIGVEPADLMQSSTRSVKPNESRYVRWNLLWCFLFCFILIPLPLWFGIITSCSAWRWLVNVPALWSLVVLLYACTYSVATIIRLYFTVNRDYSWSQLYTPATSKSATDNDSSQLYHVVCMCAFKEPLELLLKTLDSLAEQTAVQRLIVVVALEAATPDLQTKTQAISARYHSTFAELYITAHPRGAFPGEIPGKCSNQNFAMRVVVQNLQGSGRYNMDMLTGTTCDSDTIFHKRYFEFLGYDFLKCPAPKRHEVCWQAPLFYHMALDQRPFFVRVTAVLRQVSDNQVISLLALVHLLMSSFSG